VRPSNRSSDPQTLHKLQTRFVSEWETRARTSTRLEFDSTRRRPAAYSSISHGARVVRRVTLRFVSSDYFRHSSAAGPREGRDGPEAEGDERRARRGEMRPRVRVSQVTMTRAYPHYREIDH